MLRLYHEAMTLQYSQDAQVDTADLLRLYDSVGWSAYTSRPDLLRRAVLASLAVVTAWDGDRLVGLARVVGDGLTMVYLQDILVDPGWHRRGIGRELLNRVMSPFADVRQKFLITDGTDQQRRFYESVGYTSLQDLNPPAVAYAQLA
jgi:GNAT superfamily N-acetyltransferase